MNNQTNISMAITGLMLKTYMTIARTWAIATTTTNEVKQFTNSITTSLRSLAIAKA